MVKLVVGNSFPFAYDYKLQQQRVVEPGEYELVDAVGQHNSCGQHPLWVIRDTMIGMTPRWWRYYSQEGAVKIIEDP